MRWKLAMFSWTLAFAASVATSYAHAALQVFACEPEWAALTQELGGTNVEVFTATSALQDPHRIEAKPSLIAKMRRADLVVCTGAELEIGWLPMLQRQAGNNKVLDGSPGLFMATDVVDTLDVPDHVDRSMGDVHAAGNPHVHLDPRRVAVIAQSLSARLAQVDASNAADYKKRGDDFTQRWNQAIERWQQQARPLKGVRAVTHHQDFRYLFDWLGIESAGTLEAKPGVPPGAGYLAELKTKLEANPAKMVLRAAYQDERPAQWLAERANLRLVVLPYTVGGDAQPSNLFALYDLTVQRLLQGAQ